MEGCRRGSRVPGALGAGSRPQAAGFGRGGRAAVGDELEVWGGLRDGRTTGAPVGISIANAERELWDEAMNRGR